MSAIWKTVRVFISSTFRDMHAERDHLVKVVFPALRERLEKHRIYLIDIDLRWGVTREQAENDQVLGLCLQQIDECRPFFLGILGERYGWVPTTFPVEALKKFGWIQHQTGRSVTELEIIHGVLNNPAMRGHAFFYFRKPEAIADVPEPTRSNVFAEAEPSPIEKLKDLKNVIRASKLPLFDGYPARWDSEAYDRPSRSKGRLIGLEAFGERVREQLWDAIKAEHNLPEVPLAEVAADLLAEEQDYHERFMATRLRVHVPRKQINDDLFAFADGNDLIPCLVTGPSGSGKSAALARFVADYSSNHQQEIKDGKLLVVPHFIGASPHSTNLRDVLRRFCQVFKARFGFAEDVPEEVAKLSVTFREFVSKVPADTRVLLVIDALNQLDEADRAQELYWLPTALPPQVKVIVSCITDSGKTEPVLEAFRGRQHCPVQLAALSDAEQREIIRQVPSLSAKTLDDDQVRLLLSNPATANPLFLLVALEELRGFAPYERLNERIAAFPREGDTVTAIFTQVIDRLAEEFNQKLVETVLTLLASARRGLSEREMQELVAGLDGADDLFPVLRQLRPYLLSRAGLIDFYHRNLFKAARKHYLPSEEQQRKAHGRLAEYFNAQDYWLESREEQQQLAKTLPPTPRPANVRKVDELPWQIVHAAQLDRVEQILVNLEFIEAKFASGLPFDLCDDYSLALGNWPEGLHPEQKALVSEFQRAFSQELSNLERFTALSVPIDLASFLFQQVRNRVYRNTEGRCDVPRVAGNGAVLMHRKPHHLSQFVRTLQTDPDPGTSLLRFNGAVRFTPRGDRLLVASLRNTVRCFDPETGRELLLYQCRGRATDIDFSADGRRVIAGGDLGRGTRSGFVQVFDLETGQSLAVRETEILIHKLVVTAGNQIVASSGNLVTIMAVEDLREVNRWKPYGNYLVNALAVNGNRTLLATGEYHDEDRQARINVWKSDSLELIAEIDGPKYGITALAFAELDSLLVSGSNHLNNGVVAWDWTRPGTTWDRGLLSAQMRSQTLQMLEIAGRHEQVRNGRVISTLETRDSVAGVVFYPRSSCVVAVEGSQEQTSDSINVFTVFGDEPGNVPKLSGHASVPIAVDVDCRSRWVATLHAKGDVQLWPAADIRRVRETPPPTALSSHSADTSCRYVLSQDTQNHGFLCLTDTGNGRNLLEGKGIPSHSAAIDPKGSYVARFYWKSMPMNPFLGGDPTVDEPSKQWFQQFRENTPIVCELHAIDTLLCVGSGSTGLPQGYEIINEKLQLTHRWELPPHLHCSKTVISSDGNWGASLLKDQAGWFVVFRFDRRSGKSWLDPLPRDIKSAAIWTTNDSRFLIVALVRHGWKMNLVEPTAARIDLASHVYVGPGNVSDLAGLPIFIDDRHCVIAWDNGRVFLMAAETSSGGASALSVVKEYTHPRPLRDHCVSEDGSTLVLADSYPSITILQLPEFRTCAWHPMDQTCSRVFFGDEKRFVLAIGRERDINGLNYSLFELISLNE